MLHAAPQSAASRNAGRFKLLRFPVNLLKSTSAFNLNTSMKFKLIFKEIERLGNCWQLIQYGVS